MNNVFPYSLLGLDKTLDDLRADVFSRLAEVHDHYMREGWLPAALNLNRGPARGLIELGSFGRYKVYQDIVNLLPQCFPQYAEGFWLDLHAASVGLIRKPALQAAGQVIFSRFKPGGNIKIPAGRLVKTKPDGLGEVYRFVTTAEVVMPEGELSVAAPVIAETYGQKSNVTVGTIREIVTAIGGVDAVDNTADWLTSEGADQETDISLRERYTLKWRAVGGFNKYFYAHLARSVAGVEDVQVNDRHPRGQGTVDVIIKGAAGLPTQSLIDKVAALIEAERPQLDDVMVFSPVPINAFVAIALKITGGDHVAIRLEVENRLRALFEPSRLEYGPQLKIGEDLTLSRIHAEAMKANGVKSVIIESPGADVIVPMNGLAALQGLSIESVADDR